MSEYRYRVRRNAQGLSVEALGQHGIPAGHGIVVSQLLLERAEVRDAPRVIQSAHVFTSQGPGTALEFGLALVRELVNDAKADELQAAMLVR